MPEMDERELRQVILSHIETAEGAEGSRLSNERRENLDYYNGEPYGDEEENRSQLMTREVMDTVEWIKPSLMKIFHGTDRVAQFSPVGAEDEAVAEQRTDYVNHIYLKDNPGYEISTDVLMSGLVEKNGYWQIWWDERKHSKRTKYSGQTEENIAILMQDKDASDAFEAERTENDDGTVDVTIRKIFTRKMCMVDAVPPEEMVITARARSLDHAIEGGGLVGRRYVKTRGQLVEMGYDEDEIKALPSLTSAADQRSEKQNRYKDQRTNTQHRIHWSQEEVQIADVWLKIDYDGDGYSEMRMCRIAGDFGLQKEQKGPSAKFLENEETDDHPFVDWVPIRKAFNQEGVAVADVIKELQLLKSTLWRQLLNSLYFSVEPEMEVVKDGVEDWDSVLTSEPGGMKFVKGAGTITPLDKPFVGAQAAPVMEQVDRMIEGRSGVSATSAGLNPDLLQPHAEGTVERIMSAAQERVGLIARNFAEFGLAKVMLKIAKVTAANQDKPRQLRLNNRDVAVDPRKWATEFDVDIDVGLGMGNENVKFAQLVRIHEDQKEILLTLGPVNPYVTPKQFYNTKAKLVRMSDLPDPSPFYTDPDSPEGKKAIEVMIENQRVSQQSAEQRDAAILSIEKGKTDAKRQSDQEKMQFEFFKFIHKQDFDRDKAQAEIGLKIEELEAEFGMKISESFVNQIRDSMQLQLDAAKVQGTA